MNKINLSHYKHKTELKVRFMDFDALHHVNNARYLNFLEEARISYCQEILNLFLDINQFNVLVARIEIDYIKPIHYNSTIRIYTRVPKIGKKSFVFESVICVLAGESEIIVAKAMQTLVTFDPVTQDSILVPEDIRQKVEKFEIKDPEN